MSYHSRRILTPGASRKRKEREMFFPSTSTKPLVPPSAVSHAVSSEGPATTSSMVSDPDPLPLKSNRLLAGYMAHEFLSKGTLLGKKFDPARAEAAPVGPAAELKRNNRQSTGAEPSGSYAEVANLLKSDGAHVPGVINPTQLARWIQM